MFTRIWKQPAKYLINERLKSFLEKKMQDRDMDGPFLIVYEMCKCAYSKGFKYLQMVINDNNNVDSLEKIALTVRNSLDATKFQTYCTELNPDLEVHDAYGKSVFLPDYMRISFTRLRVMSHNLKVETGRWSRMSRINRVCQCDRRSVQDDKHVLLECPLSANVRLQYQMLPLDSMSSLMKCNKVKDLCNFVKDILKIYD